MPKFLVPHKSGAHRIAAIALFRALLIQSRRVPLPESPTANAELQNVVRNRFKQARHVTSYRQLKATFEAGYEAVDHLDAAVAGSTHAQQIVADLLAKAPKSVKQPPRRHKAIDKKLLRRRELAERPPRINMFDRPLPLEQLSGERKVPVLFTANHIPILRFTKPQPSSLSGYITNRIVQRQKRHDRRQMLEEALVLAGEEDKWDSIVRQFAGIDARKSRDVTITPVRESLWRDPIVTALDVVRAALDGEKELNRIMAEKMQGVVDRETAMAEKEAREREMKGEEESIRPIVRHQKD
ncbi:uncharacterized protein RCC_10282 [Ramularia collo-cygni]|uniref:Uncharacterized protein n=1 Tax=Ramularia collo-cygni TaxID=112498 RepID=A0A2D3V2R3_9PEZI|nr:uncharacterized protein RCC_10282 [Ramularia collo-cygni]CZT24557.1 uncharacterized protein RCC_10282 [Ramularia collo-cygni]